MLSLRLDGLLDERLSKAAKSRGMSRSELVRDALERTLSEDDELKLTAYERLKPWIGIFDSSKHPEGPLDARDASKQAEQIVWEKWQEQKKRREKRPR